MATGGGREFVGCWISCCIRLGLSRGEIVACVWDCVFLMIFRFALRRSKRIRMFVSHSYDYATACFLRLALAAHGHGKEKALRITARGRSPPIMLCALRRRRSTQRRGLKEHPNAWRPWPAQDTDWPNSMPSYKSPRTAYADIKNPCWKSAVQKN